MTFFLIFLSSLIFNGNMNLFVNMKNR